jgi:hypothetical protein
MNRVKDGSHVNQSSDAQTLPLRVVAAHWEAKSITSYEFARADGGELPAWEPGAHVDVHLPSGMVRQYSLCGDPADSTRYRIAVLELPAGRGGSVEVHRELRPGRVIEIGLPRSSFILAEADRYVFVAGGIGITLMLPMIREVQRRGGAWELVYGARTAEHFAFVSVSHNGLSALPTDGARCRCWGRSTAQVLGNQCGPLVIGRRFDFVAVRGLKCRYLARSTIACEIRRTIWWYRRGVLKDRRRRRPRRFVSGRSGRTWRCPPAAGFRRKSSRLP